MNKQKGITQIAVMIIMLVLAIALPVTTNLVKKSQETRSSAAGLGGTCGVGGQCISVSANATEGSSCSFNLGGGIESGGVIVSGSIVFGLCSGDSTVRCCQPKSTTACKCGGGTACNTCAGGYGGWYCDSNGNSVFNTSKCPCISGYTESNGACVPSTTTVKNCTDSSSLCYVGALSCPSSAPTNTGTCANAPVAGAPVANGICCKASTPTTTCSSQGGTCKTVSECANAGGSTVSNTDCNGMFASAVCCKTSTAPTCASKSGTCMSQYNALSLQSEGKGSIIVGSCTGDLVCYKASAPTCASQSGTCMSQYNALSLQSEGKGSIIVGSCTGDLVCYKASTTTATCASEGGTCMSSCTSGWSNLFSASCSDGKNCCLKTCSTDNDCPNYKICDGVTGLCEDSYAGYSCTRDTQCPSNMKCLSTGKCGIATTTTYSCSSRCSANYGCKRAPAYTSTTADCKNPIGTVNYTTDCTCPRVDVAAIIAAGGVANNDACDNSCATCTESNWTSTLSPTVCPSTSQQTKTWTKTGTCTGGVSHPATETVSCTYVPECVNNTKECVSTTQSRTCVDDKWVNTFCNSVQTCSDGQCRIKSTNDATINIKMAFAGVKQGNNQCVTGWTTKARIVDNTGTNILDNVYSGVPTLTNETNDKGDVVYSYSVTASGIPTSGLSNLSIFLAGPKHISLKYGKNGQNEWYSVLAGTLGLTGGTTNTYDFSEYSLLAGDVTGGTVGVPDGKIDGRDFSYIKEKANALASGTAGTNVAGDLDGNCQVNSGDVRLVKQSLTEINGQTY